MSFFSKMLSSFSFSDISRKFDTRSNYIFYKIVDYSEKNLLYLLQCINTNALFRLKIEEIILDTDILYFLHPIQSCYVGLEYAKICRGKNLTQAFNRKYKQPSCDLKPRYGNYYLLSQDRKGELCVVHEKTGKEFIFDARDLVLSKELMQEFDASQAFQIGFLAGLKVNNPLFSKNKDSIFLKRGHLRLVK